MHTTSPQHTRHRSTLSRLAVGAALCAAFSLAAVPQTAMAEEEGLEALELSGNVGLFSDYVWRGMTQTNNHPAIQGGFDAAWSVLYAGVWGSNVDFDSEDSDDESHIELDLYGGIASDLGFIDESLEILSLDLGFISYRYPGEDDNDFEEIYFSPSLELGPVSTSVTYSAGLDDASDNIDGSISVAILDGSAEVGYGDYEDSGDHFRIGVSYPFLGVDWGLTYIDFSGDEGLDDEETFVWSVSKSL